VDVCLRGGEVKGREGRLAGIVGVGGGRCCGGGGSSVEGCEGCEVSFNVEAGKFHLAELKVGRKAVVLWSGS